MFPKRIKNHMQKNVANLTQDKKNSASLHYLSIRVKVGYAQNPSTVIAVHALKALLLSTASLSQTP